MLNAAMDFDDKKWKNDSFKNQFCRENFLFIIFFPFEFHKGLLISSINLMSYPQREDNQLFDHEFLSLPCLPFWIRIQINSE
jgi:hypothetical protein